MSTFKLSKLDQVPAGPRTEVESMNEEGFYEPDDAAVLLNLMMMNCGRFGVIDFETHLVYSLEELGEAVTYAEVNTPTATMRVRREGTSTAYRLVRPHE